jgi:hypothetical protein
VTNRRAQALSGRPARSRSNARSNAWSAAELARLLGDGVPHALKSFRPATLPWSAWLRSTRSSPTPPRCEADAGADAREWSGCWSRFRRVRHFDVIDVTDWEVAGSEPQGRSGKDWLREPEAPVNSRERDWLFKPVVVHANGERQGGDWLRSSSASPDLS